LATAEPKEFPERITSLLSFHYSYGPNLLNTLSCFTQCINQSPYVAACEKVFAAIERCHEVVHEMGSPRISTFIHPGTRTDRNQTMDEQIRSVEG